MIYKIFNSYFIVYFSIDYQNLNYTVYIYPNEGLLKIFNLYVSTTVPIVSLPFVNMSPETFINHWAPRLNNLKAFI